MAGFNESAGEGGGDYDGFFIPINPPPRDPTKPPGKKPREESERYTSGSTTGSSATIAGSRTPVGFDAFGNVIYEYTPFPIPRKYYDLNPGWNTRASIPEPIGPTMYLSYKSGAAVGAIVGLTATPEVTVGYEDIILGWMTLKGEAHIIAHGEILYSVPTATAVPDPGYYNRDVDALTIKKTINKVEFFLTSEDGQGGETKIGEAYMREPVTYVTAALYLGGDTINDEILEYPDVLAGEFAPLVGGFYESSSASYLTGRFPALTGEFHEDDYNTMAGDLPGVRGFFGSNANTFIRSSLPALDGTFTSYSDFGAQPDFSYTFGEIPSVYGAFMVRDVTFGTMDSETPAVTGLFADEDVSLIRGTMPAIGGGFFEEEFPDRFTFVSWGYVGAPMFMRPTSYIVLNSRAEVVTAFTLTEVQHMLIQSEVSVGNTTTLAEIVYQALISTMSAGDVASLQRDGMSVWALNMDVMGSTRYEGFDFNSFMTIDGQTYGVNATGIHRLEGSTDDGAPIPAAVDFGSLSFGTNSRKALPYVYVGMSSTGKTVLKVESDGQTYYYTARDSTELMKSHRFELGRGLRSTFYGLSLTTDGEAFDLHNIDFQPVELKRSL